MFPASRSQKSAVLFIPWFDNPERIRASRSHSDTPHSVWLLWTSDHTVTDTQHSQETDSQALGRSNSQSQQGSVHKQASMTARPPVSVTLGGLLPTERPSAGTFNDSGMNCHREAAKEWLCTVRCNPRLGP